MGQQTAEVLQTAVASAASKSSGILATIIGIITFLFAAIYKVLPDRKLEWGDVAVGAIVTGVLFTVGM